MLPLAATSLTPSSLTMAVSTDPKMATAADSNMFHSTADQLQALSCLTEEAKLYREAAKGVLARPENKDAGPQEKSLILSGRSLGDLLDTLKQEREKNRLLKHRDSTTLSRSAKAAISIVDTLNRFEKAITSMAQAKADIAMLIWGPMQFIVCIASEIFDTLERLEEIGQHLKHCLERYKIYTNGHDLTGPLRTSLVDFYAHVIQFSVTVSQIYRKRRLKMAAYVFRKSVQAPFDQFLRGIDYLSDVIDKDTNAENFQSIKNLRLTSQTLPQAPPLPAMPTQEKKSFLVPNLLSNTFSGRDDVLECIRRSLSGQSTNTISRTAIWGIPGIGKTQVALGFANKYRPQYKNVFFVNATSPETIAATYRAILRNRQPDKPTQAQSDELKIEDLFNRWLAENPNWLLIYDNSIRPAAVRRYTPVVGNGHILYTTRNVVAAEQLVEKENAYEVLALPLRQAISFILLLQNIIPPAPQEERVAECLARAVEGLPIAIEQAVLLARLRKTSVADILPDFERRKEKRRALLKQSHPASMHEDECSVGTLITMTLDTLSGTSPQAASLFRLLVYFDTSSIPIAFLTDASKELEHHFARQETYDRGLVRTVAEAKDARLRTFDHVPFYESNPFDKDFWRARSPFRSKSPLNTLPRVDTDEDKIVERYYKGNRLLQDVLRKEIRIENALLDLKESGLIRRLNDKNIWIHDIFAQLTIAIVEQESLAISQTIAHLVLLIIYLSFPVPDACRSRDTCLACLPHATCILTYCARFYEHLTMGPELAHLTASTLHLTGSSSTPGYKERITKYYKLAHLGYHHCWKRLRSLPGITEKQMILAARAEYDQEDQKGERHIHYAHNTDYERFGASAPPRALQTLLKLGRLLIFWGQYPEAVQWITMARRGFRGFYGDLHDETFCSSEMLCYLYRKMHEYGTGYALGRLMAVEHMKRWGGGLMSKPGAYIAQSIGECAMGLGRLQEAGNWYQVTLRGFAATYGDDDRTQYPVLLELARAESLQHNHGLSLQYALRAEKVYYKTKGQETDHEIFALHYLTTVQLAVALQHFERGNGKSAKEWCEKMFAHPPRTSTDAPNRPAAFLGNVTDSQLEGVWIWGCVEYGEAGIQEWEIPSINVGKDLSREAILKFGPLRNPCCAGLDRGRAGTPRLSIADRLQGLLDELRDLETTS